MLKYDRAPNTKAVYRKLTEQRHSFLRDASAVRRRNECSLRGMRIEALPATLKEDAQFALQDTRDFLRQALRCPLDGKGALLSLAVTELPSSQPNSYTMEVKRNAIAIQATSSRGIAQALYRLQNLLRLRRAEYVKIGHYSSDGALSCALAYPAFKQDTTLELNYPEAYNENYLRRIARAGYTGFHLNLQASLFYTSSILPELTNPQAEKNAEILQKITARAARCGLDVFLCPYLEPFSHNHPVFANHPNTRGAKLVGSDTAHVLCTSSPEVLAFFDEQFRLLFRRIPALGGVILISGCEGWLHCHTACAQPVGSRCDCPNCDGKAPEETVAAMFNAIAKAVRQTAPAARCIIWNYGIFAWTSINAEKFIGALSPDCDIMANFDTGDDFSLQGARATYFDYSLSCVGPSTPCLRQHDAARKGNHRFLVKCESGTSLEYCALQYSPTVQRWYRKFTRIADLGTAGALFNWKFIGYTGGLTQELAGLMASGERKDILNRLAIREFGEDNLKAVRSAWDFLDKAIDFHPYSIQSAGYFKGPFYIGPAQPLVLDPECPPALPPCYYFTPNRRTSMIMTTLKFVEPFGIAAFRKALKRLLELWSKGCDALNQMNSHAEDSYLAGRIAEHQALCQLFKTYIRTAVNMVDFYEIRDSFHTKPYSPEMAKEKILRMAAIAKDELSNTRQALDIVKRFPLLAFSYTYHYGISTEMCEYKIAHTQELLKNGLPLLYYGLTFNRNRYPEFLHLDSKN